MKHTLPMLSLLAGLTIWLGSRAALADAPPAPPTTRPALLDPVRMVQNVRRGIDSIDLSDDQKAKTAAILDKADQQAKDLQQKIQNLLPREKIQQIAPFVKDLRQQLTDVLNPEQAKELGEKLRPGGGGGNGGGAGPGGGGGAGVIRAVEEALPKLDLSPDQQKQIQDLLQQIKQKAQDLREKAANGESIQDDLQQIRQDVRQKIGAILTPEQLDKFQELMQQAKKPADTARPNDAKDNKPTETMKPDDGMKENKPAGAATGIPAAKPAEESKEKDLSEVVGPDVGTPVPDVKIQEADGKSVPLSSFKGHVTVLVFGSLSCPTFRDRAADIEKLKSESASRAFFVLIYTREAHPSGDKQIDRNKQDQIDIEQPTTLDDRKKVADRAVKILHITMPVTVDDMNDSLATTLGGFPNGCIIIGKDGAIAARLRWAEPGAMKRMIDEANGGK